MQDSIVEIKDVWFAYNGRAVLEDISLNIEPGDFIAMIGPNGGGKTTLLKLMLGLLKPDKGSIRILGDTTEKASHHIGYVSQDVHIKHIFPITAIDVVLMGKLGPHKRWGRNSTRDRQEALNVLTFAPQKSGRIVKKLINSAVANAEENSHIDVDTLYIKRLYADEGPTLKRFRPRAMGRASRIRKRTSHLTVILDEA